MDNGCIDKTLALVHDDDDEKLHHVNFRGVEISISSKSFETFMRNPKMFDKLLMFLRGSIFPYIRNVR